MSLPLIKFKNVSVRLKSINNSLVNNKYDLDILKNISFEITEGEMLAIIGPNGGGKTTILKTIMKDLSEELIQKGEVVCNISINQIAYIFNNDIDDHNFPLTILDFLLSGIFINKPYFEGETTEEMIFKVIDMLERVGLSKDILDNSLATLSSGQMQRICFARALLKEPKILIMDEPFSNIDHPQVTKLMSMLQHMVKEQKLTVIIVVHDYYSLHNYFDRALLVATSLVAQGEVHKLIDYGKFCRICNAHV